MDLTKFKLLLFTILPFFMATPSSSEEVRLKDFLGPKVGFRNVYNCSFPCKKIVYFSDQTTNDCGLLVTEEMHFSEDLTKDNSGFPGINISNFRLLLSHDRILRVAGGEQASGSILLKLPLEKGTSWKMHGQKGVVLDEQNMLNLEPMLISWVCSITELSKETILQEARTVATVECLPNSTPGEILVWKYATGIGIIENKSKYKTEGGDMIEGTIMTLIGQEQRQ